MLLDFSKPDENDQECKLVAGAATFKIMRAEDVISKSSGNPMVKTVMFITDHQGNTGRIREHFVLLESCQWKIKQLLLSVGDFHSIKRDITAETFVPFTGQKLGGNCILTTEPAQDPQSPDRIKIKEYLQNPMYRGSPEQQAAQVRAATTQQATQNANAANLNEPNDTPPW